MAFVNRDAVHAHPDFRDVATSAVRTVEGFWKRVRRVAKARRDEKHLRSLPDRMLKDIGIHRSEIATVVRHGRGTEIYWSGR